MHEGRLLVLCLVYFHTIVAVTRDMFYIHVLISAPLREVMESGDIKGCKIHAACGDYAADLPISHASAAAK